ncbi:MAG TPA: hypothetical protein VMK12_24735 [Anaeromyxobacteraceae bacterium]|nr:hypothetical protein [Anaeromyxobacteraceae bacterium]
MNSIRTHLAVLLLAPVAIVARPARADLNAQQKEMVALANDLSKRCQAVMERWISNKEITREKLFSFLYYPIIMDPPLAEPKYATDYDRLADRDIQGLEETALGKNPAIAFAVMLDKNGYIPTHNIRFSQPLTGNRAVDLLNNRTKIIHNHAVGLTAGRNEAPFIFQIYRRDTGEILNEVSVPLSVAGVHWGAIRISYRPNGS